jgi:hypothetical protein
MRLASFGTTASYVNRPCPGASPPPAAAEEAAYVAHAVGANLLAFQIGNEPDGFGRRTAVRPKTYDFTRSTASQATPAARRRDHPHNSAGSGARDHRALSRPKPRPTRCRWRRSDRQSEPREREPAPLREMNPIQSDRPDQQIAAPSTASKAEMLIASRRCPLSTP